MKRLHYSNRPIKKVKPVKVQEIKWKPKGLWYSCGTAWKDWGDAEDFGIPTDYVYELEVDASKILFISSVKEIDSFTKKYLVPSEFCFGEEFLYKSGNINWPEVASLVSGIEISPYVWKRRMEYMWYYGWDVASGCIWNPDAIQKFSLLKRDEANA